MFRFFINGTLLSDQPIGWSDFSENIVYNQDDGTLLFRYPNALTFIGHGYEILRALRDEDFCAVADVVIERYCDNVYEQLFVGKIFITDILFNRTKCTAEVELQDETFSSKLKINWNIPVYPTGQKDKNGNTISGLNGYALDFFNPNTGFYTSPPNNDGNFTNAGSRTGYDLLEYLQHCLVFYGINVPLVSDWYSNLPNNQKLAVGRCREIRVGNTIVSGDKRTTPNATFFQLWSFIRKAYNLVLFIENGQFRIEEFNYILDSNPSISIDNVKNVEEQFDQSLLYNKVSIGSGKTTEGLSYDINVPFVTHNKEDWHFETDCNIDASLDISDSEIVYDNNSIEELLFATEPTDNDELIFIVQYLDSTHPVTPLRIASTNPFGLSGNAPRFYNEVLLNNKIAERYTFYGNVASQFGETSNAFLASLTFVVEDSVANGFPNRFIVPFDNDYTSPNFDTNNNYGNGTTQGDDVLNIPGLPPTINTLYTIPSDGGYGFRFRLKYNIDWFDVTGGNDTTVLDGEDLNLIMTIREVTPSLTLIDEKELIIPIQYANPYKLHPSQPIEGMVISPSDVPFPAQEADLFWFKSFSTGNIIYCDIRFGFAQIYVSEVFFTIRNGSSFNLENDINSGGIIKEGDALDYNSTLFSFNRSLNFDQQKELRDNTGNAISFSDPLGTVKGFIKDVSTNLATGETTWSLRTSDNLK